MEASNNLTHKQLLSIFGASWVPLGASLGHLGVLLGAIGGLKMTSFTQHLLTCSLLDPFGDAQLQALAVHAS